MARRARGGREPVSFSDLADSEEFARFFRMVWNLTGSVVGLVGPKRDEGRQPFGEEMMCRVCRAVRSTPRGLQACVRDPRRHLKKALARREPVVYECHAGLMDFVAPVFVEGRHVATIEGGQVLLRPPSARGFRRLVARTAAYGLDRAALRAAYFSTAQVPREKLLATVELVRLFVEHFSETAWRLREAGLERARPEVRRARDYIRQHHREALSLEEVARDAGLSPAYFSALFSRETGATYSAFLQRTRVEAAKRLLRETDRRVTDVAFEAGFGSLPHFNHVFRRLTGSSPREYRRASRGDG
jgi:AraC-like DNA-binding protein/ligand-binding sensor protein